VKMVAICVDCNGNWTQVKPIVNGNNWDFETYIDVNGDFKRAMNVGDVPCSMLFDTDQNLVCRMNNACKGSEEFICSSIMEHLNPSTMAVNVDK
jgi:cytochrome c biogenesis protein CcmG, thiol:disulfide interchange protein DsbE